MPQKSKGKNTRPSNSTWFVMPPSTPNGVTTYTQTKPAQIVGDDPSWDKGSLDRYLAGGVPTEALPQGGQLSTEALPQFKKLPTEDLSLPTPRRLPLEDLSLPRTARPPTEDLSRGGQVQSPFQPFQLPQFKGMTMGPDLPPPGDIRKLSPVTGTPSDEAEFIPKEGEAVPEGTPGAVPMPETPEESDMIKMLMARRDKSIADERAFQGWNNAEIARLGGDNPLDLRPLAALVDTWTGSNMLPGFDRPRNNGAAIAALQAAILKSKGNITDSETELLKSRLMAQDTAARDDKKYVSQSDIASALQDALNARQQALFGQQTGMQGRDITSREKIAAGRNASAERRATTMGGALNTQKQDNRNEDKKIAATKLDDDRAIAITNSPVTKFYRAQGSLQKALDRYKDLVSEYGVSVTPGRLAKERLQQAYGDILLAKKVEAELGVIAGPDMPLMNKAIPDATASGLLFTHPGDVFGGSTAGKESLLLRIDEAKDNLKDNMQGTMGILRAAHPVEGSPRASSVLDALNSSTISSSKGKPKAATSTKALHEMTQAEKEAEIKALESKGAK